MSRVSRLLSEKSNLGFEGMIGLLDCSVHGILKSLDLRRVNYNPSVEDRSANYCCLKGPPHSL